MADLVKSIGVGLVLLTILACALACVWVLFRYAPRFVVGGIVIALLLLIAFAIGEAARHA